MVPGHARRVFKGIFEMVQDTLIRTLLRAALEETGAQRGLLILPSSGEPRIAAEATRRHKRIVVRLHDEVVIESLLPESVLNYVQHTRESVVIDNAAARATFAADPYVRQHKTGSILCLPLLNQGELVSFLLLENHLATGVFTPARITVLKLVASLAASALENSRLYGELQKREAKTRRLVDANIIGIYVVDIGGPILESNDAYLRMLGYERVDLVSGGLFVTVFFGKAGTRVPVLVGVARLKDPRNQAVVFALDISEQKRMEATALEACMIEQRRIARKLHDALLQNFQGMMFQFQAVRNLIPRHPEEALRSLNDAISEGERSLDESRDKIQNLRLDLEGNLV
jgi:signal transduction histidine kinase